MKKGRKEDNKKNITRKDAIKKAGFAAFSAATMILLLNDPAKAQGTSEPELPPGGEWGDGWD